MPETHYIEIDEEIISTVGRLRKSGEAENIFVFPKRSLILQSIINLKLLGREAEKLGKTVVIMTQDEQGMRLAEKAGLRVREYQDRALREYRQDASARFTVRHGESIPMPEPADSNNALRHSNEIGSESFYGDASISRHAPDQASTISTTSSTPALPEKRVQTLRVRNATPPVQTALNSVRDTVPPMPMAQPPVMTPKPRPEAGGMNEALRADAARKEKLRRLFEGRAAGRNTDGQDLVQPMKSQPMPPVSLPSVPGAPKSKKGPWLWSMVSLVLLAGVVFGGYFFLRPEAIIEIQPQQATQTVRLSLVGTTDASGSGVSVPARYVEEEKTIRLSREATGKDTDGNGLKARGTIVISNAFSEAAQSLVATTRFETADGRLYRLVSGVTVPGTKTEGGKTVPGMVEAQVMADKAGTKSNLDSGTTFAIPGFKGGPKFEKITAESKGAFTGGEDSATAATLSVSGADLENARLAAMEEAKKTVINGLVSRIQSGEIALEPSFEVVTIGIPSAPTEGMAVERFDYEARFQVRGFIISEAAIRNIFDKETTESAGVVLRPHRYALSYGSVLSNFETKRVDLTVESRILFRAPLDEAVLKNALLGLDEAGIRNYLETHPEVKRLQVEFKPKVFIATIPNDPARVTVNLSEPDNE